jgi:dihydrofolate reductase
MKALIVAIDEDCGIGKDGKIPWYFPQDFAWFKYHTKDAVVIMGYNTFAEIAEKFNYPESKKLLPGRISYVISRKDIPSAKTVKTGFTSIQAAVSDAETNYPDRNIFFIGGERIFQEAIPLIDKAYLTKIPARYDCNSFFPILELYENHILPSKSMTDHVPVGETSEGGLVFWEYIKT